MIEQKFAKILGKLFNPTIWVVVVRGFSEINFPRIMADAAVQSFRQSRLSLLCYKLGYHAILLASLMWLSPAMRLNVSVALITIGIAGELFFFFKVIPLMGGMWKEYYRHTFDAWLMLTIVVSLANWLK